MTKKIKNEIKKVVCNFELNITSNLNENQIRERIHNVLNDLHSEKGDAPYYFDSEEVESADLISVQIKVS